MKKGKVTGIGGIFFKCKDPKAVKNWYNQNLGLNTDEYGVMFESRDLEKPEKKTHLQWSTFAEDSNYFDPSKKEFMINYRVENLEELMLELQSKNVIILDEIAVYDYGKFLHILGPEGQKIELWEAVDEGFSETKES